MFSVQDIVTSLSWLIKDAKGKVDEGYNAGNYSDELKIAMELLQGLKEGDEYLIISLNSVHTRYREGQISMTGAMDEIVYAIMDKVG